jgi:hypothetical protein
LEGGTAHIGVGIPQGGTATEVPLLLLLSVVHGALSVAEGEAVNRLGNPSDHEFIIAQYPVRCKSSGVLTGHDPLHREDVSFLPADRVHVERRSRRMILRRRVPERR